MSKGGAQLLARTASRTDDPQTLRMVAGALANLCGNGKFEVTMLHAVQLLEWKVIFGNVLKSEFNYLVLFRQIYHHITKKKWPMHGLS